jgi:hypothetical protein
LLVRHSFKFTQNEHLARARREHIQGSAEQYATAVPNNDFFWVREALIDANKMLVKIYELPGWIFPQRSVIDIPYDLQQPRTRIAASKAMIRPISTEIRLLHNVLRILVVASQPSRKVVRTVQVLL